MEFAADSTSLLKIFIFPTLLNQNSIYSSLFRLPCCDLVVISPLHYFFLVWLNFLDLVDLATWIYQYC